VFLLLLLFTITINYILTLMTSLEHFPALATQKIPITAHTTQKISNAAIQYHSKEVMYE